MAALHTGPGPSLGIGALLGSFLTVLLFLQSTNAAPVLDHPTGVDEYYAETGGCYYNFQHYGEGDRIITNEPCLNCTCHNRMLMCYLRVCPFTKAIGQDCKIEKKPEQCCPVITCPEVPVHLLTSSTTTALPPAPPGSTAVGHPDNYGCTIDEVFYTDGAQVPGDSSKPCELCYCIRNKTACVMQECTLHVEGCRPVYAARICCPVRYDCDYQEATEVLPETTVRPTPGLVLTTTTPGPLDCHYGEDTFADGALLPNSKPCEHCYCMRGDIVCAVQECGSPLDHVGKNCTALPPLPGQCCPEQYQCENGTVPFGEEETESVPKEPSQAEQSVTAPTPVETDEQTQHEEENEIDHNQQNVHEAGQETLEEIDQAPEAVEGEIEHVTELEHLTTEGIHIQPSTNGPPAAGVFHSTEGPSVEHGQIDHASSSGTPESSSEHLSTLGIEIVTHGTQDKNHGVLESASQMGHGSEETGIQHESQTEVEAVQSVTEETPQEIIQSSEHAVTDNIAISELTSEALKPDDLSTETIHQEQVSENIISAPDSPLEQNKPEGEEAPTEEILQEHVSEGIEAVSESIQEYEPPEQEITQEHSSEVDGSDDQTEVTTVSSQQVSEGITEIMEPDIKPGNGIVTDVHKPDIGPDESPVTTEAVHPVVSESGFLGMEIKPIEGEGSDQNENIPVSTKKPIAVISSTETVQSETGANGIIVEQTSKIPDGTVDDQEHGLSTATTGENNLQPVTGAPLEVSVPDNADAITEASEEETPDEEAETQGPSQEHVSGGIESETERPEEQKPEEFGTSTDVTPSEHTSQSTLSTVEPVKDQKPGSIQEITEVIDAEHVSGTEDTSIESSEEQKPEVIDNVTDTISPEHVTEAFPAVTTVSEEQKPGITQTVATDVQEEHVSEVTMEEAEFAQTQKPESGDTIQEHVTEDTVSTSVAAGAQKPGITEVATEEVHPDQASEGVTSVTEVIEAQKPEIFEAITEGIVQEHVFESAAAITESEEVATGSIVEQNPASTEPTPGGVEGEHIPSDTSTEGSEKPSIDAVEAETEAPKPDTIPEVTSAPMDSIEGQKPESVQSVTDEIQFQVPPEVTQALGTQKPEGEEITTDKDESQYNSQGPVTETIGEQKPGTVESVVDEVIEGQVPEDHISEVTTAAVESSEVQKPGSEAETNGVQPGEVPEGAATGTESDMGPEILEAVTAGEPEHETESVTATYETIEQQKPETVVAVTEEVDQEHLSEAEVTATETSDGQSPGSSETVTVGELPQHVSEGTSAGSGPVEEEKPGDIETVTEIHIGTAVTEYHKPEAVEAVTTPGGVGTSSEESKPEHVSEGSVTVTEAEEQKPEGIEAVTDETQPEQGPEYELSGTETPELTKPEISEGITEVVQTEQVSEAVTSQSDLEENQKPGSNTQQQTLEGMSPVTEAYEGLKPETVTEDQQSVSQQETGAVEAAEWQGPEGDEIGAVITEDNKPEGLSNTSTVTPQELKPEGTAGISNENQGSELIGITEEHTPSISTSASSTESSIKVTDKHDELTSLSFVTSGPPGESSKYPSLGPTGVSITTSVPQGIIPGEGNCLVEGQTYQNNSNIPPINPCVLSCRCVSSIVHCVKTPCSPPPAGLTNCVPVKHGEGACCDTYLCDGDVKPGLESDSQMAATEEPSSESQKEPSTENLTESQESLKPTLDEKPQVEQQVQPEDQELEQQTMPPEQVVSRPAEIIEEHVSEILAVTQEPVIEQESGTGKPGESETEHSLTTLKPLHSTEPVEEEKPEQPINEHTEDSLISSQPVPGPDTAQEQNPENASIHPQSSTDEPVIEHQPQTEPSLASNAEEEKKPDSEEHDNHITGTDQSTFRPVESIESQKPGDEVPIEEQSPITDIPGQAAVEVTDEQKPEVEASNDQDLSTEHPIHEQEESHEQKPSQEETDEITSVHKPTQGPFEPVEEHTEQSPATGSVTLVTGETSTEPKPGSQTPVEETSEVTNQASHSGTEFTSQKPENENLDVQTEHGTPSEDIGKPQDPENEKPLEEQTEEVPFTHGPVQPVEEQTEQTISAGYPSQSSVMPIEEETQRPIIVEKPISGEEVPVEAQKPESVIPIEGEIEPTMQGPVRPLDEIIPASEKPNEGQTEQSSPGVVDPVESQEYDTEKPSSEQTEVPNYGTVIPEQEEPQTEKPTDEQVESVESTEDQTPESEQLPEQQTEESLKPIQTQPPSTEEPSLQTNKPMEPFEEEKPEPQKPSEEHTEHTEQSKEPSESDEQTEHPIYGTEGPINQKPEAARPVEEQTVQSMENEAQSSSTAKPGLESTKLPMEPVEAPKPDHQESGEDQTATSKPSEGQTPMTENPTEEQTEPQMPYEEQTIKPAEGQGPTPGKPIEETTETPVPRPTKPSDEEEIETQRPADKQTEKPFGTVEAHTPESQEEQTEQTREPVEISKPESPSDEQTEHPIEHVTTQVPQSEESTELQTESSTEQTDVQKPELQKPSLEVRPESLKPDDIQTESPIGAIDTQKPESGEPLEMQTTEIPKEPVDAQESEFGNTPEEHTHKPIETIETQEPETEIPSIEHTEQPLIPAEAQKPDFGKPTEEETDTQQTTELADIEKPETESPIESAPPAGEQMPESEQPSKEHTTELSQGQGEYGLDEQEKPEFENPAEGQPQEHLSTERPGSIPAETQKPDPLRPVNGLTEQPVISDEDIDEKPEPGRPAEEQTEQGPVTTIEGVKPESDTGIEVPTEEHTPISIQPVEEKKPVSIQEADHGSTPTQSDLLEPIVTPSPDVEKPAEEHTEQPIDTTVGQTAEENPTGEQTEEYYETDQAAHPATESTNEQKPKPPSEQSPVVEQTHSPSETEDDLKPGDHTSTEGISQVSGVQTGELKPQSELPTQEQIPEFEEPNLKPTDEHKPGEIEPVIGAIEHITQGVEQPASQSTEDFNVVSSTDKPVPGHEHQQLHTTEGSLLSSVTEGLTSHLGHITTDKPSVSDHEYPHHPQHPDGQYENLPGGDVDTAYPPSSPDESDYDEEQAAFGPGTCRYGGKVYVSAQQIPREDPCDFCFCFRSDIICLQQSCPPPIPDCHQEPIEGFCCPRYQCEVSMATMVNISTTTTTTTTTLPPHFLSHAYKGTARKTGCQVQGHAYHVGEIVRSASGPCLLCRCGGDGQMKCDPKECSPEPMLRKMIMAAASRRR